MEDDESLSVVRDLDQRSICGLDDGILGSADIFQNLVAIGANDAVFGGDLDEVIVSPAASQLRISTLRTFDSFGPSSFCDC
jgi:hypothetical protein